MLIVRQVPNAPGFKADSDGNLWTQWVAIYKGYGGGRHQIKTDEWRLVVGGAIVVPERKRKVRTCVLICEAFHGLQPSSRHECCHTDDDHNNSKPNNLYWGLHIDNMNDASLNGKLENRANRAGPMSFLDEDEIEEIRDLYSQGIYSRQELAEMFHTTNKPVYNATKDIHLSRNIKTRRSSCSS